MPNRDPTVHSATLEDQLGPGAVLAERYRLIRQLGEGGMGSVWEAEHTALGSTVAIKLIRSTLAADERSRDRFVTEARAVASLRSPYVVQIFDHGVHGEVPYIAMERLHGESLAQRLSREHRLASAQVVMVIDHIARAIAKAHAAGIVHRDLKPDNVFIVSDEDGQRCKVLDFGIAKMLPEEATTLSQPPSDGHGSRMLGTLYYMSPEQATDPGQVQPGADLWSMAVIAYECLLGARPFDGSSVAATALKIVAEPPPVPSEHGDVPAGFDAWFARATRRSPDQRHGSARELADALAIALGVEIGSGPAIAPPRPSPRTGHARWWLGALTVAAVGTAATLGGMSNSGDRAPPRPTAEQIVRPPAPTSPAPVVHATPSPSSDAQPRAATPPPIQLHLEGPAGARIYREDTLLATLPDPVVLPHATTEVSLRIVAPGFEEQQLRVIPHADQHRILELNRRRPATPPARDAPATRPTKPSVDDLEF